MNFALHHFFNRLNFAAVLMAFGSLSVAMCITHSAWAFQMSVTNSTTYDGTQLVINPPKELVVHGPTNPLLTLTNGATTSGIEGMAIGAYAAGSNAIGGGNGQLLIANGSTLTNSGIGNLAGIYGGGYVATGYSYLGLGSGITGTATVTGTGSTWNNSEWIFVGFQGFGTLNVENGAQVNSLGGSFGAFDTAAGTAAISGMGSKWNIAHSLYVGDAGFGMLNIENGGFVTNSSGIVGQLPGSVGSATVTGNGSKWNNSNGLIIGDNGVGTLDVFDGGSVTNTFGYLGRSKFDFPGYNSAGVGTATISGSESLWHNTNDLYVGLSGDGILNIEEGGTVNSNGGYLGYYFGSTGEVNVSGNGSTWNSSNSGTFAIGRNGNGTLKIENGGKVNSNGGSLGVIAGATGIVNVIGNGSMWNNSSSLAVGQSSYGSLNIHGGGSVNNTIGFLGYFSGSTGSVTVSGDGSMWNNSGNLILGGSSLTSGNNSVATLNILNGGTVSVDGTTKVHTGAKAINLQTGGTLITGSLDLSTNPTGLNWTGGSLLITGNSGDIPTVPTLGTLGGTGTINEDVMVLGTLAPGQSIGTLNFEDATLSLAPGSTLNWEFDENGNADLVYGTGTNDTLNVMGIGTLELNGTLDPTGQTIQLFDGFETMITANMFEDWAVTLNGSLLTQNQYDWSINTNAGYVSLQLLAAIPEPGSMTLLGLGCVSMLLVRSRRRAK